MKHCPNPLCPHRVTQRAAARYEVDAQGCEHCSAALSEGPAPAARTRAAPSTVAAPNGLFHKALVTLGCLAAFVMANHGRVPGLTFQQSLPETWALRGAEGMFLHHAISRVCAGFLLAGVAARVIPSLRTRVDRAAWWIAATLSLLCCVAWACTQDRATPWMHEYSFLWGLVATVGLAGVITRQGLVHGVAALLGAWCLDTLYTTVSRIQPALSASALTPFAALVWALSLAALVALTAWTLTASKGMRARIVTTETALDSAYRVSSTRAIEVDPALRAPASAGDALMVFPFVSLAVLLACQLFGREAPAWFFAGPPNLGYCVTYLAITLGCVAWFTRVFNPPGEVAVAIVLATGVNESQAPMESVRKAIRVAIGWSALFVVAVTALGWLQEIATGGVLGDSARMAVILTAVVLDAVDGFRAQKRLGSLVAVRSESRVYAADLTRALLEAHEIPAVVSSRHYRTLQPFLGTVSTIDVAVAAARGDDANAALNDAQAPNRGVSDRSLN